MLQLCVPHRRHPSSDVCLAVLSAGARTICISLARPDVPKLAQPLLCPLLSHCYIFLLSHLTPLFPTIPTSLDGFSQFARTSERVTYCLGAVPLTQ